MNKPCENFRTKDLNILYREGAFVYWEFRYKRGRSFAHHLEARDAVLCDPDFSLRKSVQKCIRRDVNRWLQEQQ